MSNIKILGAGPSGLSAAINLAKEGYKVDVFERNKDVGKRFRGDLQGLENWSNREDILSSLQEMNIKINFDCNPLSELSISNGSKVWNLSCKRPAFYIVKRGSMIGSLDFGLKDRAIELGVDIYFGKTIPLNEADIIATGPIPKEVFAIDKGIVFETNFRNIAVGLVNDCIAFKGYSYLLVVNGYGCMCTVLFDKFENINSCFDKTKETFKSLFDIDIKNSVGVGGVGCFSNRNLFQNNGQLHVGESAGLQDLLWGFGIRSAIYSGFLAARSIAENKSYEKLARKYFEKKLKSGLVNRFLWENCGKNDYSFIMNRIANSRDPLRYLRSFHNFNIFQRLIYPFALNYIKRRYNNLRI